MKPQLNVFPLHVSAFIRKVSQVYVLRFVKTDDLNPKIENCFKQMLLPLTMRILLQRRLITY